MREHKIPAVSIAVIENYKVQWAKAYGVVDSETGARADEETTFLAGSISKSVNALGVLLAAADGTLALDKPINEQLDSWKLPDNELTRASPVTLRKLLSHTAGTTVHGFPGYVAGAPLPTVPQILDGQKPANTDPIRVDLAPGTKFRYSGGGTTISMLALSERSRKPYPQVLAERVLGPLAMVHSSYDQVLTPERQKPVELVPIAPDAVIQRDHGRQLRLDGDGALESSFRGRQTRRLVRLADSPPHHLFELEAGRFDNAVATWRERVKGEPKTAIDEEHDANDLGYQLLDRDPPKAIDVLRLVATVFPESSNAHDSLGEAYVRTGDKPHAIEQYEEALRTLDADPRVPAQAKVNRRTHAEEELAKLRKP
jgi:CubicO group peptidase (beta-lactamase class C family)